MLWCTIMCYVGALASDQYLKYPPDDLAHHEKYDLILQPIKLEASWLNAPLLQIIVIKFAS